MSATSVSTAKPFPRIRGDIVASLVVSVRNPRASRGLSIVVKTYAVIRTPLDLPALTKFVIAMKACYPLPYPDTGCALQSTSMPAPHRRNAPNCRPMAEGGMRKCSAVEDFARRGACPPLGSGWGVAESAVPIRCTKPQLRLFIPWCAGTNRDERLVRRPALRTTSMPALHPAKPAKL